MKYKLLSAVIAVAMPVGISAQDLGPAAKDAMPPAINVPFKADRATDVPPSKALPDRVLYTVSHLQRGTSVPIKMDDIVRLCGDQGGCSVRLAMYNWDGTGRAASRETLLYYNPATRGWRASSGDAQGFDANSLVEHVQQAFSCYFTDGEYAGGNGTDLVAGFNLLSWFEYNADCWLTIIG